MFSSIAIAIKQLFSAITVLFGAAEKGAKAIDHLAQWSEETAASFSDEARIMRVHNRSKLLQSTGVIENQSTAALTQ